MHATLPRGYCQQVVSLPGSYWDRGMVSKNLLSISYPPATSDFFDTPIPLLPIRSIVVSRSTNSIGVAPGRLASSSALWVKVDGGKNQAIFGSPSMDPRKSRTVWEPTLSSLKRLHCQATGVRMSPKYRSAICLHHRCRHHQTCPSPWAIRPFLIIERRKTFKPLCGIVVSIVFRSASMILCLRTRLRWFFRGASCVVAALILPLFAVA